MKKPKKVMTIAGSEGESKTLFRRITPYLFGGTIMAIAAYMFLPPEILFPDGKEIPFHIQNLLVQLGDSAIASRDVPISAVIILGDKVVGEGYNTVVRDGNAAGHAEINALSNAIRKIGLKNFMKLNRDSLELISTYEPCPMCRAAMALYQIKKVEFLKRKSFTYYIREEIGSMIYRLREREVGPDSLQDFLFRQHPDYSLQK